MIANLVRPYEDKWIIASRCGVEQIDADPPNHPLTPVKCGPGQRIAPCNHRSQERTTHAHRASRARHCHPFRRTRMVEERNWSVAGNLSEAQRLTGSGPTASFDIEIYAHLIGLLVPRSQNYSRPHLQRPPAQAKPLRRYLITCRKDYLALRPR